MLGLEARRSVHREPLPRWRRASFQRESPGWMRICLEARVLLRTGATGSARGATSASEMDGFAAAEKFGES